jgi:hypothetical protein
MKHTTYRLTRHARERIRQRLVAKPGEILALLQDGKARFEKRLGDVVWRVSAAHPSHA